MAGQESRFEYDVWPDIGVAGWAETKRSLHLYAQILGKMRVALSPPQPNWMSTALSFTARGVTTGFMPCGLSSVEARLDVFDPAISLAHSNGQSRRIALLPVRCVADVLADVTQAIDELHIDCRISPTPQEISDTTPLNADRRPCKFDPDAAARWFAIRPGTRNASAD